MRSMSSRERILACIRHQQTDILPLLFHSFGFQPPPPHRWSDADEQARTWLRLGVDAWLWVEPTLQFHPSVTVQHWHEQPAGERWPLLVAAYQTPAGVLRQEVWRSDDWISPQWPMHRDGAPRVQLFDDYNVPRYRRCPIETEDDLAKVRYLLAPLDGAGLDETRQRAAAAARLADELDVALVGQASSGTDAAIWLCGVDGALHLAIDRPDLFTALLDIIHAWDRRNIEVLLDTPVDLIMRRGYYEGTSFWSPTMYREHFVPRLTALTRTVHQAERLMGYTMSVGVMPLVEVLAEVRYDLHYLLDPRPNDRPIDLTRVKAAWRGRTAVAGGLSTPITLEQGTPADIRTAVAAAATTLGAGGGLILSPAEGIFASTPWASIEAVIAARRELSP